MGFVCVDFDGNLGGFMLDMVVVVRVHWYRRDPKQLVSLPSMVTSCG